MSGEGITPSGGADEIVVSTTENITIKVYSPQINTSPPFVEGVSVQETIAQFDAYAHLDFEFNSITISTRQPRVSISINVHTKHNPRMYKDFRRNILNDIKEIFDSYMTDLGWFLDDETVDIHTAQHWYDYDTLHMRFFPIPPSHPSLSKSTIIPSRQHMYEIIQRIIPSHQKTLAVWNKLNPSKQVESHIYIDMWVGVYFFGDFITAQLTPPFNEWREEMSNWSPEEWVRYTLTIIPFLNLPDSPIVTNFVRAAAKSPPKAHISHTKPST